MRWLNNLATRAAFGFALVWAITATAIAASAVLARDAEDTLEQTLAAYADDLAHASQAQFAAERVVAVGRGYLLTTEPGLLARVREAEAQLDVALHALDRGDAQPTERALLQEVARSASRYHQLLEETFEASPTTEDRQSVANAFRERLLPAREELSIKLGNLVAHKQRLQQAARQKAARTAARSVRVTIGLGALALVMSGLLARLFTRRLAELYRRERASAQKASSALTAKEELLGIVAHDLRTPLSAILLRASSLAKAGRDPKTAKFAESIQRMCNRMAFLVQGLLDAASIEAGRMSVVTARCPLEAVLAETIDTFNLAASERNIRVEQAVAPRELEAQADRERLVQVLSNLVGNALKFTPDGGVIRVSARKQGRGVRFEVRDTGPGIVPEHLPHLFDRYWKADARGARGAGLGLYIAKGIVEAHGGRIWVESKPGEGSSFLFEVPTPPPDEPSQPLPVSVSATAPVLPRSLGPDHAHS
jgi:signal transduction histidine kinase